MQTYGITAEQAGDGRPDLVWLLKEGRGEVHPYSAGDRLPVGVQAFPGQKPNDMVLWVESHDTVIAGDTLVDFGQGLHMNPPVAPPAGRNARAGRRGLRPLLELPVEHVLAAHGGPFDRAALERALA
jgi:glyoxylase-like metal-dependent hydrolase (beta-lactamase superfamily II)